MKIRYIISACLLTLALSVLARETAVNGVTTEANGMRAGDRLSRMNMVFSSKFISDTISIWDFSQMRAVGTETETNYNGKGHDIVENENRENRLYETDSVSQSLTRHYRGGMDIRYQMPEKIVYPILCGTTKFDKFFGEGKLGSKSYIKNAGYTSVSANMTGDLITPDCDTIKNVLRLRYHRSGTTDIGEDFSCSFENCRDSSLFSNDSISHWLANDSVTHTIDKWLWYARGYRYPVMEMRKYKTYLYSVTSDSILVAYYYPLSRQENEIQNDSINEYYRENATEGYVMPHSTVFGNNIGNNYSQNGDNDGITNAVTASSFSCEVYPTVTTTNVTIRLYTEQKQEAVCYLVSSSGVLLWTEDVNMDAGYNELACPMEYLSSGVYFVVCSDGNSTISTKIVKTE